MKDLFFIDQRYKNVYVVRNPKSRRDAEKRLIAALVPSLFEDPDNMQEYLQEVNEFREIP